MSLASKVTLGLAVAGCIGTFFYVTATQELDRMRMHEGVLRDIENQKKKRQLASEQEAGYSKEGFSLAKT
ncbi:unnamed protein product [Bemisia tabaci]|uniref:Uncharacterized protein n=1 Tax=Bemisia tabaci TaxID=7038 RepID=A0A9P0F6P9_BEMTA|nr:unnamed protein product [Bemisia tabaci]